MTFRILGLPAKNSPTFSACLTSILRRKAACAGPSTANILAGSVSPTRARRRAVADQLRTSSGQFALSDAVCDLCARRRSDLRQGERGSRSAAQPHAGRAVVRCQRHDGRQPIGRGNENSNRCWTSCWRRRMSTTCISILRHPAVTPRKCRERSQPFLFRILAMWRGNGGSRYQYPTSRIVNRLWRHQPAASVGAAGGRAGRR